MKNRKKVLILTSGLMSLALVAVAASVFYFRGSFDGHADEMVNSSITFTYSNFVIKNNGERSSKFKATTSNGTDIYMKSYNDDNTRINENNKAIASFGGSDRIPNSYFTFYQDSSCDTPFVFQNITSITIIENNAGATTSSTFSIYNNSNGSGEAGYSSNITSKQEKLITEVSGYNYIYFKPTGGSAWLELKSITINYSCNPMPSGDDYVTSISASGYSTEFVIGSTYSFDGIVTAHYHSGNSADVTSNVVIETSPDMSSLGYKEVVLSYTEEEIKVTTSFNIHVVDSIENYIISYVGIDSGYNLVELYGVDTSNSTMPTNVSGGSSVTVNIVTTNTYVFLGAFAYDHDDLDLNVNGNQFTFTMPNYSFQMIIFVDDKVNSISVSGQKETFTVNDVFTFGGTVTANLAKGGTADVTANVTFEGYDLTQSGNQTVTVKFQNGFNVVSTTYSITVNSSSGGEITSLKGTFTTTDTTYYIFVFESNGTGYYQRTFSGSIRKANFTYSISDNTLTLTLTSFSHTGLADDAISDYANPYKPFISSVIGSTNNTGTITDDSHFSIRLFHTTTSSGGNINEEKSVYHDFTKQ